MSDCVYLAFAAALGRVPRRGSYFIFRTLKSLVGTPEGIPSVSAPLVLAVLARYNGSCISIGVHPWIYAAGFESRKEYYTDPGVVPSRTWRMVAYLTDYGDQPLSKGPAIYLGVEYQHAFFCTHQPSFLCEMSFEVLC